MLEVEIKLPVASTEELIQKLTSLGFSWLHSVRESDCYFDNEQHFIRHSGAALRLRTIEDLTTNNLSTAITYKGKKIDTISMTRLEFETAVGDGKTMIQLLAQLGYFPAAPDVVKFRREYTFEDMHACVDEVQGLGSFLELEIIVSSEKGKDAALERISETLTCLGYSLEQCTQNSYLSMLMHIQD